MLTTVLFALSLGGAPPDEPSPHHLEAVPIRQVILDDAFWAPRLETCRRVTIPDALGKFEKDGALANFDRVRDGKTGEHGGPPWYDGLIYEMVRAASDFLAARPDPELERRLDGYIERIAAAAAVDPDGYINTYTQLMEPAHRWGRNGGNDNWQHDVYNAGALTEAAVHFWEATGKTSLLKVAARLVNHMCDVMGGPPRSNVVPGHSLAEEAVLKLYLLLRNHPELKSGLPFLVDESRYRALVEFWIGNRGRHEGRVDFAAYGQDHMPVLEQPTAEGHAVRATLLYTGLIAAARVNGREDYYEAARRLWDNVVGRKMYVTGGLGSTAQYEGFGPDYFLPNDGYLETCAAVGAAFFHRGMLLAHAGSRYADELERALYNGILCGVSLAGNSYFYENPLEARKSRRRWAWHACPCCPPMLLKILAALPGYVYATDDRGIYVNLFVGSRAVAHMTHGRTGIRQVTRYPWDGGVKITLEPEASFEFDLGLRIPGWCRSWALAVNGDRVQDPQVVRGFARLRRTWKRGDTVDLDLSLPVERVRAHPRVEANRGRVALARGPLVYCLEAVDNGGRVRSLSLPPGADLSAEHRSDLLGGVTVIRGKALASFRGDWPDALYSPPAKAAAPAGVDFLAVPYYANSNREPGDMTVWIPEMPGLAEPAPRPTIASEAMASASHCWKNDTVDALNDQAEPSRSDDGSIPRMTFWDHKGTTEWVQYDFAAPRKVSAVEVYWWDERRIGAHCRVPKSWRLLHRSGESWIPVSGAGPFAKQMDRFNRVAFEPVETTGLRIEVELEAEWSGGILEWRVE